jgi:diguanylate cyclase (GGDEF)-like protein
LSSSNRTAPVALPPRGRTQIAVQAAVALAVGAGVAAITVLASVKAAPLLVPAAVVLSAAGAAGLYRLFTRRTVEAMRLALTDPLTGLGNARHFLERLERDLDAAEQARDPVTLVLLDVDDFKLVNDRYGHPAGDAVLVEVAGCLRRGGEAFRLGGDEFALLLTGRSRAEGVAVAEAVLTRIATAAYPHGGAVTASAGVATFPAPALARGDLVRAADGALYRAKHLGKDCACEHQPGRGSLPAPALASSRDREAFRHAVVGLAGAVRARGLQGADGPLRVGEVAAQIALEMDLPSEHVELIRLAGAVSDVGKLALPDDVLFKAGPLSEDERRAVQRHPEIGHAMLDSLGADPLAIWVRHHHERWDGRGYPERLAGERIPLAARILFVADAFDSMTSEQAWRPRLPLQQALEELRRCAGTQFDPAVVEALAAVVARGLGEPPTAAAA